MATAPDPVLAYAEYTQQVLGVPWPTQTDQKILRKRVKELFERYPKADFYTLCRVTQWCRNRKKREPRVWMVVDQFRAAWVAGALPELDVQQPDANVESRITAALELETRESWRARLLGAVGQQARQATLEAWEAQR